MRCTKKFSLAIKIIWLCIPITFSWSYNGNCITNNTLEGNGTITTEVRALSSFNSISAFGAYDMVITMGDHDAIEATGEENLLLHLITKINDGILYIYMDTAYASTHDINLRIDSKEMNKLHIDGRHRVIVKGIRGRDFDLQINGTSDVLLSGVVENFIAESSGTVELDAKEFHVTTASITSNGFANTELHVSEKLEGVINGVGQIGYYGNPRKVEKTISGIGEIENLGKQ